MIRKLALGSASILLFAASRAPAQDPAPGFADEVMALLSVPRVVGREGAAAELVVQRLGALGGLGGLGGRESSATASAASS